MDSQKPQAVVTVRELSVNRGPHKALNKVSFKLPAGQIVGLVGPSGSGKSTLMRALVGVQKVSSGEITIFGQAAGHKKLRSHIGYLTQAPAIYPDITIEQNLKYFAKVIGAPKSDIERVIKEVDLDSHKKSLVANLSGGQKARVNLAVALLGDPELLVLDEPTVGLDPILRQKLWKIFGTLAESGKAVIVSSHVMDEAERCDQLLLLRDGKLLAHATISRILEHTKAKNLEAAFISLVKTSKEA